MRPQIPPHLLPVVDAVELDEGLEVLLVLAPGVELIRDAAARKPAEDGRPIGLEAGVASLPERGAGREREQVRQEVAGFVQELDRAGAIGYRDVDVQSEDQERAGQLLELFDDVLVALARRENLDLPFR